ncbi:MAG: D-alanyl-D-alanine carboxypeptidase/D-alanyl-D-alanine-endopeptidase, partial [Acidobacteria bacterium]|nr:D-alanyl-D-alanine carboxypeptidase/D-alanyl-D-alanine-endopeptidase [Acidobacteriota bacterium]
MLAASSLGAEPPALEPGVPAPEAASPAPSTRLTTAVDARVAAARRAAQDVGVYIADLATGSPVYEQHADRRYIIASNTKLFTTSAALDALGPGWVQETPFLARGQRVGDRWVGDLAVLGSGDPNISGRNRQGEPLAIFHEWGERLRKLGVRRVEGDLYLVHGLFEGPLIHPDWPRDQLTRWYEAPVHALAFNDDCVLVRVWPSARPGAPPRVELVPDVGIFEIENAARTSSSGRGSVGIDRKLGTNVIQVRGTVPRGPYPVEAWVTVEDPLQYFGAGLLQALEDEGIRVDGKTFPADPLPQGSWRRVA